jgi:hypothetical protein
MEKLWIHSPSSDLKQVDHSESSSILSEVQVVPAAAAAAAKDGYGATSRDIIQVDQEDQEQLQVQEGLYYKQYIKNRFWKLVILTAWS